MASSVTTPSNPLQNKINFPPFFNVPDENNIDTDYYHTEDGRYFQTKIHWCFIGEITDDAHSQLTYFRNRVLVKDLAGQNNIPIAFYPDPDDTRKYFDFTELKKGNTVCIRYAKKHNFLDMTVGFRVECLNYVKVIKCSLDTLRKISALDPTNRPKLCWTCGSSESKSGMKLLSCQQCKYAKYCGRDCQKSDWKKHKKFCRHIQGYAVLVSLADREFTKHIPFKEF